MHIGWPFHDRHKEILEQPFPELWLDYLKKNVRHYELLHSDEQVRLRDDLRVFISEKNWEGALGFELTDEAKVVISAQACLLTVAFPKHDYFPNVQTIIVYPSAYVAPSQTVYGQVIATGPQARLGEAHGNGPIILAWSDVICDTSSRKHGHNLVFHEFAHKLDFRDGDANGAPLLRDAKEVDDWSKVFTKEYALLVERADHKGHSLLDPYGATNPAEFFAVCTECFFEASVPMREEKPELYRVLLDFYGIDWADREELTKPVSRGSISGITKR